MDRVRSFRGPAHKLRGISHGSGRPSCARPGDLAEGSSCVIDATGAGRGTTSRDRLSLIAWIVLAVITSAAFDSLRRTALDETSCARPTTKPQPHLSDP